MPTDIDKLDEFLGETQSRLKEIVIKRPELIQEEMRFPLKDTFSEIALKIDRARKQLKDTKPIDLENEGLTGKQLDLKLTGFWDAVKKLRWRLILKWINIILGSLSSVLKVLGPVKEYKESIEASFSDDVNNNKGHGT